MNKTYVIAVSLMIFVIPFIGFFAEHIAQHISLTFGLFAKWFIFSAAGLRLFVAGIKQTVQPSFTAKNISYSRHGQLRGSAGTGIC
ncbi:hypothetical protein [Ferruginibacter sp.]